MTIIILENSGEVVDDGFTENELKSVTIGLKEVALIKSGAIKPLSMNDLWD